MYYLEKMCLCRRQMSPDSRSLWGWLIFMPLKRLFQLVSRREPWSVLPRRWCIHSSRSDVTICPPSSLCSLRAPAPHHPHPHLTELKIACNLSDSPSPHVKAHSFAASFRVRWESNNEVFQKVQLASMLWLRWWNDFWNNISASRFAAFPHIFCRAVKLSLSSCMCDSLRHHLSCFQLTDGEVENSAGVNLQVSGNIWSSVNLYTELLVYFHGWASTQTVNDIIAACGIIYKSILFHLELIQGSVAENNSWFQG